MSRRPCWCPKTILWELNSFLMQTLPFVPINLHRCWPREWKHYIANIGELSLMSLGDRTQVWTQRRKWIRPCVYLLQTTSQTSRSYRTKKEKRAARANFVVYLLGSSRLTFSSVSVMITFVVARNPNTFLIKTPATFFNGYMSFKIQTTKRITSFLWKPTFECKGKE